MDFQPRRSAVLVTPADPILTIDQGKLRAGLDWVAGDPRDELMTSFIAAATGKVQDDTNIALGEQTWDVTYTLLPLDWPVTLPWRPVSAVTLFAIAADGTRQAVPDATFAVDGGSEAPQRATVRLTSVGSAPVDLRAWVVQIVAGWPTVAAIPPLLMHTVGLLTAHYATAGRDLVQIGQSVDETPLGYADLIGRFQLVTVASAAGEVTG